MIELILKIFEGSKVEESNPVHQNLSIGEWLEVCKPGDEWEITKDQEVKLDSLLPIYQSRLLKRNKQLRLWREEANKLVCKFWIYEEGPSNVIHFKRKNNNAQKKRYR